MKNQIHKKPASSAIMNQPFFGGNSRFFQNTNSELVQAKFFESSKNKNIKLSPLTGLSPTSFIFYEETSNWKTSVVTDLYLSYYRFPFESGEIFFKIQIGVPIKLANGDSISNSYAQTSCSTAANLAVSTLASLHYNEYGTPGWTSKMPRKLAYYMQLFLTASIPGARVSTTITSSVKQHPAVWL